MRQARSSSERARRAEPDLRLTVEIDAIDSAMIRWLEHRSEKAAKAAARAVQGARVLAEAAGGVDSLTPDVRRAYLQALRSASDAALHADDPPRMLALADETARVGAGHDDRTHLQALTRRGLALRFWVAMPTRRRHCAVHGTRLAHERCRRRSGEGGLQGLCSSAWAASRGRGGRARMPAGRPRFRVWPVASVQPTVPGLLEVLGGDWRRGGSRRLLPRERGSRTALPLHTHLERAVALARLAPQRRAEIADAVLRRPRTPRWRIAAAAVGDVGSRRGSTGPSGEIDDARLRMEGGRGGR